MKVPDKKGFYVRFRNKKARWDNETKIYFFIKGENIRN